MSITYLLRNKLAIGSLIRDRKSCSREKSTQLILPCFLSKQSSYFFTPSFSPPASASQLFFGCRFGECSPPSGKESLNLTSLCEKEGGVVQKRMAREKQVNAGSKRKRIHRKFFNTLFPHASLFLARQEGETICHICRQKKVVASVDIHWRETCELFTRGSRKCFLKDRYYSDVYL